MPMLAAFSLPANHCTAACGMDIRIQCLCIDSNDPAKAAQFWEAALGWRRTLDEADQIMLESPEGSPKDGLVPDLLFSRAGGYLDSLNNFQVWPRQVVMS
jgi:hypothetical protein